MSELVGSPGLAKATVRHKRRLPAIWIIPVLAVAIGAWLAWTTISKQGPTITVSFENGEGLQAGQSQLKFKDLTLGTVKSMTLNADHTRVNLTIATTKEAEPLLTDQTIFWVVKPRLFAGNLSGLGTLVSGSYVGMRPGTKAGKEQREFVGLEDPPVLETNVPGHTFLVKADRLGSITLGSPVFFRDLTVGEVLGWDLGDMAASATIHVFVREPFDKYVHDSARFWNASGLSVKLGAGGIDVQVASLRALLLGGIAFDTQVDDASKPVAAGDHVFPLFADQEAAAAASYSRKIPFVAEFSGSVGGLAPGAAVTFRGLQIGHVLSVNLSYDAKKDAIVAPVRFEVEPERFLGLGKKVFANPAEGVAAMLKQGLRATLDSSNLLTGQLVVAVEFDPSEPQVALATQDGDFVMPTVETGGFKGLQTAATDLLNKFNDMPLDKIGNNLATALAGASNLTNGAQTREAIAALTATMASAQDTLRKLDNGLSPMLRQLPDISNKLQGTLTSANKLVLSLDAGYGDNTRFNRNVDRLMAQLASAVESFRALADLLQRHPEALIRGRTDTGLQ